MGLKNLLAGMTPRQKQFCAIALAGAAVTGTIYLSLDNKSGAPVERYDPKSDQKVSVITNDNNKNLGLDAMAGRIKLLDSQNRELRRKIDGLVKDRLSDKADTSREREWKEKFDALSSEVNQLRAAQRDVNIRMHTGETRQADRESQKIDNPFQVREQRRREIEGDALTQEVSQSPQSQARQSAGGASSGRARGRALRINVVTDPESPAEAEAQVKASDGKDKEGKAYIPAGSIITGTMVTGADFPTGNKSRENPTPCLVRLSKSAILPNRYSSDVRECFMLVSGHGDLATERASLRSEMLSCIRNDGGIIQTRLSGYVSGEDGKAGLKGRLVSKTGQMIARTLVAGFLAGMAEAFDYDPVEVLDTTASNHVKYQSKFSADAAKGGLAKGAHKSLNRVADFYMNLADQMTPVVEITAGRQVDLIVISGTYLDVMSNTVNPDASRDNPAVMTPTRVTSASAR